MENVTDNTYVDSDVRNGGTYTYTVRCVDANGNFVSGYNNTGWTYTYVYGTVNYPEFNLTNESNGVRISWKSMNGVHAYKVFYKNSKGGTYTYTVRGVDANGSYVTSFLSSGKTITHK